MKSGVPVLTDHGYSTWKEICAHISIVVAQIRWLIRDETSIDVSQDTWISILPLSR